MRKALMTGITGQDGSYLSELLIGKGYQVHGVMRRASNFNTDRIDHLYRDSHEGSPGLVLHYGDLTDAGGLRKIVNRVQPDEVYNLGAQSHVQVSFNQPEYTAEVVGVGPLRLLEAVRDYMETTGREVRFYQAGSSEMFGSAKPPQTEQTPFHPRSPYGVSKVAAHWYCVNCREAYGMFVCNGILFNHESPRRGETFVTRKITRALTRIYVGRQKKLFLGNLDARRDWGYAGDYVVAMWQMLQQPRPDDYVIATGRDYSVTEFLEEAGRNLGLDWRSVVEVDSRYKRPSEVDFLLGDASKARKALGWSPTVDFRSLVALMVSSDLELARQECSLVGAGHSVAGKWSACA